MNVPPDAGPSPPPPPCPSRSRGRKRAPIVFSAENGAAPARWFHKSPASSSARICSARAVPGSSPRCAFVIVGGPRSFPSPRSTVNDRFAGSSITTEPSWSPPERVSQAAGAKRSSVPAWPARLAANRPLYALPPQWWKGQCRRALSSTSIPVTSRFWRGRFTARGSDATAGSGAIGQSSVCMGVGNGVRHGHVPLSFSAV